MKEYQDRNALRLDYLWPVFYLPGLRTLYRFELDASNAQSMGRSAGISQLENLSLVGHFGSRCKASDIRALINQSKVLKSFSFYVEDDSMCGNKVISNTELWNGLQRHVQTLERIDIYRYAPIHRVGTGNFGLLCEFTRLKHLCIQVEVILGGCCHAPVAPFRLRHTLPSSLESLTLYGEKGFEAGDISDLPMQVMEVVNGEFPALRLIILMELECLREDNRVLKLSYRAVERRAKRRALASRLWNMTNAQSVRGNRKFGRKRSICEMTAALEEQRLIIVERRLGGIVMNSYFAPLMIFLRRRTTTVTMVMTLTVKRNTVLTLRG